MIDIDRRYGPLSGRVWTLIANLAANAVCIYGLAVLLGGGNGWPALLAGGAATLACIALLSQPSR